MEEHLRLKDTLLDFFEVKTEVGGRKAQIYLQI